ncbi:MAG: TIGR03435 family protein [Acidobacteriia bacterium]|nr:TIGR03435 family protein [Terriglobia bacterium]
MRRWIGFALAIAASAQTFEVASVKIAPVTPGDLYYINLGTLKNDTLTFGNASLADCIRFAYGLTSDAQLSGPDWMKSKVDRYDIVAKTAPNTPREQVLKMLQALLAERFKLAMHAEKREMSYYALVISKSGSKLRPAGDTPATLPPGAQGQLRILSNSMPMQTVATLLSRYMRAFVVDRTGLEGRFEVRLVWTPDDRPVADDERGPSVFTAVQEQLGLKLEPRKGPMDVFVVDHAEKTPVEN